MFPPSSGTGQFVANSAKIIRFVRKGCANRPFYHIVVSEVCNRLCLIFSAPSKLLILEKNGAIRSRD